MRLCIAHRADHDEPVPRLLDIQVAEQNVIKHAIDLSKRIPNSRYRGHIKAIFREQRTEGDPNTFLILDEQKTCWLRFSRRYSLALRGAGFR